MFFKRKRRNNLIYATVAKQEHFDSLKYKIKFSKNYKSSLEKLRISESDISIYLAYIFSKGVKKLDENAQTLFTGLEHSKMDIDKYNAEIGNIDDKQVSIKESINPR